MVESVLFVAAVTVAVVDALKDQFPQITGKVTVLVAGLVGALLAVLSGHVELGITALSVAQGVLAGLTAAGGVGVAKRI